MKTKILTTTILASVLTFSISSRATMAPQVLIATPVAENQFTTIAFSDSAEAAGLHRAYRMLAYGDHDYKGYRVKAMKQVKAAADLLGLDLSGDDKDKTPQPLSDADLREAQGLLEKVLNASEVKDQKRISKHIDAAIEEINKALSIK